MLTFSAMMWAGGGGSQSAILDMGSEMAVHSRDESEGWRPRPDGAPEAMAAYQIWGENRAGVWRNTQDTL